MIPTLGNMTGTAILGAALLGAIVSMYADYKREIKYPKSASYKLGYFNITYLSSFYPFWWYLILTENVHSKFATESLFIAICTTILALVSAYYIYKRKRWAWILGTILTINQILWLINAIYLIQDWRDLSAKNRIKINPESKELATPTNSDLTTTINYVIRIIILISAILLYLASIINAINGEWTAPNAVTSGIIALIIFSLFIIFRIIKNNQNKNVEKGINLKKGFFHLSLMLSIICAPAFPIFIAINERSLNNQEAVLLITLAPIVGFASIWAIYVICRYFIIPFTKYLLDMFNIKF